MAARDILKNFNLFVDGRGYAGQIGEYTPPNPSIATEEFRAGGMDAPIELDMGQELMETSFQLRAYDADVLAWWGVAPGNTLQLTARGALESHDGTVKPVVHNLRGMIKAPDRGTWSPGQTATLGITMSIEYFKESINDTLICEIDVKNMIRNVGGNDRLAEIRAAIGI